MKKKTIYLFASTFLLLSSACTKNTVDTADAMIRLNAAVEAETTRSVVAPTGPISSNFAVDVPIGVFAKKGGWLAGASANYINNDTSTISGAGSHPISFSHGPYYYPNDGSVITFYAYAPAATVQTLAGVGTSPVVRHAITGKQDVMWATNSGFKMGSSAANNPVLNFAHKLTQIQFTFKSGTGFPVSGEKVVSLLLKAQPTTVDMTVDTGVCSFSGSADMQALSSADQAAGIEITSAGNNANSPLMTNAGSSYTVDVVVKPASGASNVTYSGIPITLNSLIGDSHMVVLTFNEATINATATISDWISGAGGTATAQ